MKDWILRYAEQSSDEEEEEEEGGKKTAHNPELEEKFDPNDRYLILTAQLYDAKEMAAAAKTKGDKAGQRMAQDRIRVIQQEMKQLESHPMFNPAIKVVDVPQKEKKTLPLKLDGKSPKQFLIDWVRKEPARSPPRLSQGPCWKIPDARCVVGVEAVSSSRKKPLLPATLETQFISRLLTDSGSNQNWEKPRQARQLPVFQHRHPCTGLCKHPVVVVAVGQTAERVSDSSVPAGGAVDDRGKRHSPAAW
ncbi:ATP-dependent RNA helicase DHX29 [Lates japonicus]|uniref:ATP-dependent RNA helicase DHX29 n=1 Tax=Lates japonicus TaxID=270547 RepID=A0AAD3MJ08_LATJO|nr:ATP-dependent RNA helicase DHX29 [Lates japonicus]